MSQIMLLNQNYNPNYKNINIVEYIHFLAV